MTRPCKVLGLAMPSDLDIYRTAATLISNHGENALIKAALHEDAMWAKGDLDGVQVWRRVRAAICALQDKKGAVLN